MFKNKTFKILFILAMLPSCIVIDLLANERDVQVDVETRQLVFGWPYLLVSSDKPNDWLEAHQEYLTKKTG